MVHEIYPKQNRRVTEALEGSGTGHRHWSTDRRKGAGRCPGYFPLLSLLTSDYFIRFSLSAFIPKLSCGVLQNPFPCLLSARLFCLLSLFLLSNREIFITQYVNLARFNPLLIAPNLSLHTDYASISYLLNYFRSQLLTEQI